MKKKPAFKTVLMKDFIRILRPPGGGLLTFTTGSQKAKTAMAPFFSDNDFLGWDKILNQKLKTDLEWVLIGVPSDVGGGVCRGAAHGPLGIRSRLFQKNKKWIEKDLGDIPCIPQLQVDSMLAGKQLKTSGEALWGKHYRPGVSPVSPLSILEEFLVALFKKHKKLKPLVLGGDHSISGAVFNALARTGKLKHCGVLHFDAHTDLLETRFGVRDCFATWTYHALQNLKDPKCWVQLGIRASGQKKEFWEKKYGLQQFWADELQKKSPEEFARFLVKDLKARGCSRLYITNDIDGTDSKFASATGTPEGNGLDPKWVRAVIRQCVEDFELIGADMMEVAPVLGDAQGVEKTIETAVSYIEALKCV